MHFNKVVNNVVIVVCIVVIHIIPVRCISVNEACMMHPVSEEGGYPPLNA